ncbi:MAG: pyridoxal-phosphate dependent enzyme [Desulfurococcales archaeon]|nr:pyridoxal-phosphate dependent enzyme [Desulfurococcales archaeon]
MLGERRGLLAWKLYCPRCGWTGDSEEYKPYCPRCGSPLEVLGELPRPGSILGEGGTPVVRVGRRVYKLDYLNPTGSFKDRGASLSVYIAERLGYECVVEDTSGNTGLAVAAYAARLGLKARIHAPRSIAPGKARIIRSLGGELRIHETREAAAEAAKRDSSSCFYVAHAYSPIFIEGTSSIARELAPLAREAPILVPVSSGTLILGLYRGLKRLGVKPRIIAVQAVEAASLLGRVPLLASTKADTSRLADALVLKNPPRLEEIAAASSGLVVVGDPEIEKGMRALYGKGFIVEPSSASVEAAAEMAGLEEAVLVLTGSGLKYH